MTTIARRSLLPRGLTALAGAAALGLALTACNPLSITPTPNALHSLAEYRYTGPSPAWFEVSVSGAEGYQVKTRVAVWVPNPTQPGSDRTCGSATVRGLPVPCGDYPEFPFSELHRSDLDPAGSYWAMHVVRPDEKVQVHVQCFQGGPQVVCPPSTKVSARTVVDPVSEKLVGDLENAAGR